MKISFFCFLIPFFNRLTLLVWRAGHERAFGLVDMMNTVGLRPWTYLLGMFIFDMVLSLVAGIGLLAFAVGLGLLNFKDAPIDLLVGIVFLSAYAFNASTLLISMLAGSKASVLSLAAACMTIAFAAICTKIYSYFVQIFIACSSFTYALYFF